MKLEMYEFCRRATVPCGFADSEGEIKANAKMVDFLGLNKDAPEMVTLLEKIRTVKSPFFFIINLVSDFKKAPKIWQFHFLPLLGHVSLEFWIDRTFFNFRLSSASSPVRSRCSVTWLQRAVGV